MKIKASRRFIWTAVIGFCFWILGFYLFHFQLHSEIEQGKVSEFESAFHEKTEELNDALIKFAHNYTTKKSKDDRGLQQTLMILKDKVQKNSAKSVQ